MGMDVNNIISLLAMLVFIISGVALCSKKLAITGIIIIVGSVMSMLPVVIPRLIEIRMGYEGFPKWFEYMFTLSSVGSLLIAYGIYRLVKQYKVGNHGTE